VQRAPSFVVALAVTVLVGFTCASAALSDKTGPASTQQQLALLRRSTEALAEPGSALEEAWHGESVRSVTGERTALPVVGRFTDGHGVVWREVLFPGRPNRHHGWISVSRPHWAWPNGGSP
jgi:hypothetical protein